MWPRLYLNPGKVCHMNELDVMVDMKIGHVDTEQKDDMKERKKRRGRKGGCPHSPRDRAKLWDSEVRHSLETKVSTTISFGQTMNIIWKENIQEPKIPIR